MYRERQEAISVKEKIITLLNTFHMPGVLHLLWFYLKYKQTNLGMILSFLFYSWVKGNGGYLDNFLSILKLHMA